MLFKHKISQYAQVPPNYSRPRLKSARAASLGEKPKPILLKIPEISSNLVYDAKQGWWMLGDEVYRNHILFNFKGVEVYLNPINGNWLDSDKVGISSSLEQKIDGLLYGAIMRTNIALPNYTREKSAKYIFNKMRYPKKYS